VTAADPASALGRRTLQLFTPKMRAERAAIHNATGGLSTEMNPPGSSDAKKKLLQLVVMLRVAAA